MLNVELCSKFVSFFFTGGEKDLMVILEYAPHGNLLSFLKGRRPILKTTWKKEAIGMEHEFTTCDLAATAYQVAKGMEFLASRRVSLEH